MTWTYDREETLRRLWNDGLPGLEIAEQLGLSKNSVVAKAHRMGLEPRQNPVLQYDEMFEQVVDLVVDSAFDRAHTIESAAIAVGLNTRVAERMWDERITSQYGGDPVARTTA